MELTHTQMKFEDSNWHIHEVDFKDNQDKFIQIIRANANKEVINVQVNVRDEVYELLSNQLYF